MQMTDEQLAKFVGITEMSAEVQALFIEKLPPEKRALFDRMANLEIELDLWQQGLGPKPQGVLIDTAKSCLRRRAWR